MSSSKCLKAMLRFFTLCFFTLLVSAKAYANSMPTVLYVVPATKSASVQQYPKVYIGFDKAIQESQLSSVGRIRVINERNSNVVPATVLLSDSKKTAYILLDKALTPETHYAIYIPVELLKNRHTPCENCESGGTKKRLQIKSSIIDINELKRKKHLNSKKHIQHSHHQNQVNTEEDTTTATITKSQLYQKVTGFFTMKIGYLNVNMLSAGIPTNFVYVANDKFGAQTACDEGITDACFTGTNAQGLPVGPGIQAANWMCEVENAKDGSYYEAFLADTAASDNIGNNVLSLSPNTVYITQEQISTDGSSSAQYQNVDLFYTTVVSSGDTESAYIVSGETANNVPQGTDIQWGPYWTGATTTGSGSPNTCGSWSGSGKYPTNNGYGATGYLYVNSSGDDYSPASLIYNNDGATYGCGRICTYKVDGQCTESSTVNEFPLMCIQQERNTLWSAGDFIQNTKVIDSILTDIHDKRIERSNSGISSG